MQRSRAAVSVEVKRVIGTLCRLLASLGLEPLPAPEAFRRAKFGGGPEEESFWMLLSNILQKSEVISSETSCRLRGDSRKLVAAGLWQSGYHADWMYGADGDSFSSRDLLLALGWLLADGVLEKLLTRCVAELDRMLLSSALETWQLSGELEPDASSLRRLQWLMGRLRHEGRTLLSTVGARTRALHEVLSRCQASSTAPPAGRGPAAPPAGRGPAAPPAGRGPAAPPAGRGPAAPPAGRSPAAPPAGRGPAAPPAGCGPAVPPAEHGPAAPPAGRGRAAPPAGCGPAVPPAGRGRAAPPAGRSSTALTEDCACLQQLCDLLGAYVSWKQVENTFWTWMDSVADRRPPGPCVGTSPQQKLGTCCHRNQRLEARSRGRGQSPRDAGDVASLVPSPAPSVHQVWRPSLQAERRPAGGALPAAQAAELLIQAEAALVQRRDARRLASRGRLQQLMDGLQEQVFIPP